MLLVNNYKLYEHPNNESTTMHLFYLSMNHIMPIFLQVYYTACS